MAKHLEILVEEPSAEAALKILLPKIVPDISFDIHAFQGKHALLKRLENRLRGYRNWLPCDWRIVVLVDRDNGDCRTLKGTLESAAANAGLVTRTLSGGGNFHVLNRIAIEELEAWFFGDEAALRAAYPRIPANLTKRTTFRNPDAIKGGTWEALERVLQRAGYHKGGLDKKAAARDIAEAMSPDRNRSHSFQVFCAGLRAAAS